ncbi:MAG TPA: choice-of-anchor D domain-containing protein [Candidatus Nanopelagicales bacterium]|nr:choice-of-anchor D domain-containing protein [Candidatus Nanopelagicales bacterium]
MAAVLRVPVVAGAPPAASPREPSEAPPAAVRPEREPRAAVPAAPAAVSLEVPGSNERVSLGPKGEQLPATQGLDPAISADGRLVAYRSIAIVGSRSAYAVRLYDRSERSTIQLYPLRGTATDGFPLDPGRGILGPPAISADGRFVAFAEAVQGGWRILMWSADAGIFAPLVGTKVANLNFSTLPSLSEDGRYLAFLGGSGPSLSARVPPRYYRLDRDTGAAVVVGIDTAGRQVGSTFSEFYGATAVSADGTRVAFTDQSPTTDPQVRQVWLRDVTAGRTILVSATPAGREATGDSSGPSISADGQVVAFQSNADDLVPDDRNAAPDVFVWREGAGVRRVSVAPDGTEGNGLSVQPAISGDGRHLAFASGASTLVPGDTTGPLPPGADATNPTDIFAADLVSGRLARVSVGIGPSEPNGSSSAPSLSRNGRFVAFTSSAANLVPDDTNETTDVFVRERISELTLTGNPTDFGSAPVAAPPGTTRTVTVTSTGGFAARVTALALAGANADDFLVTASTCSGTMLYPGDTCTVQLLFLPLAAGSRTAELRVSATTPAPPTPARLTGAGGAAKITVKPAVGPPGTVTIVTGSGFGPGVPIALTWSTGISPTLLAPVVTDAKGGFVAQLLVLPRDRLGTRQVRATRGGPGAPPAPVTAKFLVVAGTVSPPVSGMLQVFVDTLGRPIILRR